MCQDEGRAQRPSLRWGVQEQRLLGGEPGDRAAADWGVKGVDPPSKGGRGELGWSDTDLSHLPAGFSLSRTEAEGLQGHVT